MVVDKDNSLGVMFQRAVDDLAHIDRCLVYCAARQGFLGNQPIAVIKTEHDEIFDRFMRQQGHTIMLHRTSAGQDRAIADI